MLTELRIENFAIIDRLELGFESGLIIFTGETGAGKSIIMDAVEMLLGGKVDGTVIRAEADLADAKAALEAAKDLLNETQNLSLGDRERLFGYLEGARRMILPEPDPLLTATPRRAMNRRSPTSTRSRSATPRSSASPTPA